MNDLTPDQKIEIIQRSLRCCLQGSLALLPVAGLPMAVVALSGHRRIQWLAAGRWNPAHQYLRYGQKLAWAGLALALLETAIVVMIIKS